MPDRDLSMAELSGRLSDRDEHRVVAVDSHTAGESTRVLVGGMPAPPAACRSLADLRVWMQRDADHLRRFVTQEPRGHRDLVGAWITPPLAGDGDFGVVFMDARRYPFACGTATVGAITTAIELGLVTPRGEAGEVVVETPAGPVRARAELRGDRVDGVVIEMVPSCMLAERVPLELGDGRPVSAAIVYVGGCLALVSSAEMPCALARDRAADIVGFGEAVISAANAQHAFVHPISGQPTTIDGCVLYDPAGDGERRGDGAVVYGAAHLDRSPCGTGTAAKMTRLHHRGELALGERYENRGILGTTFVGWLAETARVGAQPGVRAHIRASAHLVSTCELFAGSADPFPEGFLLPR